MARAKVVFPVPGGPKRVMARGGRTPCEAARSGSASGSTTRRSMRSFSFSMPATFDHRSFGRKRPPRSSRRPAAGPWSGSVFSK